MNQSVNQFKNVLLIAPLTETIVNQAESIVKASRGRLTLMSVAPILEDSIVKTESGKTIDLQELLVKDLEEETKPSLEAMRSDGLPVESLVVSGQPFIEIIRQVIAEQHDLIIMQADGAGTIREQLFGTLSMHLMRKCPCPVWIIKPDQSRGVRKVLAAVDPAPTNIQRTQLNVQILDRALAIANNEDAELHVLHAWNTLGGNLNRGKRWMSKHEIQNYVKNVELEHQKRLNELVNYATDGSATLHLPLGRPGEVIPKFVAQKHIDLLVMGTVCRTGIPGFFIGNTAETTLSQVNCSVLTVKPNDFETPVRVA